MKHDSTTRKRILIADDFAEIRTRLVDLLSELECVEIVGPAASGDEALRMFNQSAPHGLVLDLQMPGLNGLELLMAIRKRDRSSLIIILTNHASEEFRRCCLDAGANFFLHKSTEFEQVRDIIQTFTERRA